MGKRLWGSLNHESPLGPDTYVPLTLKTWWENLPWVTLAGLIFSAMCAPVVLALLFGPLIPAVLIGVLIAMPAWVALLRQLGEIAIRARTNLGVMFRAFANYWPRGVGLGLLASFPVFAAIFTLPAFERTQVPIVVWIGIAADLLGLLIVTSVLIYAVPLIVIHDVDTATALRNAVIMASRYSMNTLGLLGLAFLFTLTTLYISSGLLLFWPPLWGMFIVNNCRLVVKQELEGENPAPDVPEQDWSLSNETQSHKLIT